MLVTAAVLSVVLAAWMVFVQPFAGRRRYRLLLERLRHDPSARLHHYRRGIAFEWVGAALVGLLALLAHSRLESLWPPGTNPEVSRQIPGLVVAIVVITAVYRFGGQPTRRALAVQLRPVAALLPRATVERRVFAFLAITAGVCEELLYRGFGLAALRWVAPRPRAAGADRGHRRRLRARPPLPGPAGRHCHRDPRRLLRLDRHRHREPGAGDRAPHPARRPHPRPAAGRGAHVARP